MEFLRASTHHLAIPRVEVERAEAYFKTALPSGYVDAVTSYGEGMYCDLFRIFSPDRLPEENKISRDMWSAFWPFENSDELITQAEAADSIPVAGTIDGDNVIFYPPRPDRVYILPRHERIIYTASADFSDLWDWDSEDEARFRCYEPFKYDVDLEVKSARTDLVLNELFAEFCSHWSDAAHYVMYEGIEEDEKFKVFFVPSIGARIGLSHIMHPDQPVFLRLWQDVEFSDEFDAFLRTLNDDNFTHKLPEIRTAYLKQQADNGAGH
jgi:hypothetical protein